VKPTKLKKVIFFLGCFELGGAERQSFFLAEYLKRLGVNVEFWAFNGPGPLSIACEANNIPYRIVDLPLAGPWYVRPFKFLKLISNLRQAKADILLPYTSTPNIVCCLIQKCAGVKLCVWNQRDEGLERYPRWLEALATRFTSLFFANSQGTSDFLRNELFVPSSKIHIVENGISLKEPLRSRAQWREYLDVGEDVLLVTMIANFSPFKDHVTLIKAWNLVTRIFNRPCRLILAGNQANHTKTIEVKDLVNNLGLTNSVIYLDRVDDISGLLQAVDLVVHSSKSEGLSNVVLEAMASGRAVVGTDIPGIRLALGNLDCYAPVQNAKRLSQIILELLINTEKRNNFGKRNREAVLNRVNSDNLCAEIVAHLTKHLK
jgi:glycosyltransferase involved in cell wall biosynthesis